MSLAALPTLLLVPPLNCLAVACAGAVFCRRRLGRIAVFAGLAGLLLFSLPAVSMSLLWSLEQGLPTTPPATDPPGAIVILSGDYNRIERDGHDTAMVGRMTLERERAGVLLARRTGLPILVTGGVMDDGDPSLADMMSQSLTEDFLLPPRWTEGRSMDTWENAKFSAAILRKAGIHSVYLVTHGWHMKRSLIAFRAAGLLATAAPVPLDSPPGLHWGILAPRVSAWTQSYYALHEWIGLAWYHLRG
jgi:uncharacterized SAM-binding protein YcdF (DUF218 family)